MPLYIFRPGRTQLLERVEKGESPDDMLYGFAALRKLYPDTHYIERDDSRWDWKRRLWFPVELRISRRITIGFSLHFAMDHLGILRKTDVIISPADSTGLPVAMFKALGLVKTPMIYFSQGLTDYIAQYPPSSRTYRFFHRLYRYFLRRVECIVVLGQGARDPLLDTFNLDPQRVIVAPFGVDEKFWQPDPAASPEDYILSVGSDMARDYDTLLAAADDYPLKIVTRLGIQGSATVEIATDFSDLELRQLYRAARFVVIPLKNVAQPSGQSATLQAMACGKAVILTKTAGLWEPDAMRHLENCYLVEPYDHEALRAAIRYLHSNPGKATSIGEQARKTVEARYTSLHFATRIAEQIERITAHDDHSYR